MRALLVGTQGTNCASAIDCAAGYLCVDPDGAGGLEPRQCLHLCRNPSADGPGPSGDCPSTLYGCFRFDTPISVGATTYGVCDF